MWKSAWVSSEAHADSSDPFELDQTLAADARRVNNIRTVE